MHRNRYEHLLGEAARWAARLSAHDCAEFEQKRFEQWRAQSPEHRAAFAAVQSTSDLVAASLTTDPRLQALLAHALKAGKTISEDISTDASTDAVAVEKRPAAINQSHSVLLRRFALAAGIACLLITAWTVVTVSGITAERSTSAVAFEAPIRSARHVVLADGSRAHLDAGSKLLVSFTQTARRIELVNGRAYFEVAHDASRPFSVSANGTRTVALGTKFEVQRKANETTVKLAEGSVSVSGDGWQQKLQPGEQLDIGMNEPGRLHKIDAQEIASWSRGWLVFRDTPLVDALQEINRYSVKQVVTADDSLLSLKIAGSFVAGDAQSVVDAIAEVLPIRVVDGGNREIILFKRYDSR